MQMRERRRFEEHQGEGSGLLPPPLLLQMRLLRMWTCHSSARAVAPVAPVGAPDLGVSVL